MKKRVLLLLYLLLMAVPASASSLVYTFSSGDILAANPTPKPTYGLGRIDFVSGEPVPHVIVSGESAALGLGEFTRDGTRYIYVSKVKKPDENTTFYDVYDESFNINSPKVKDLTITVTPNPKASADLTLAVDTEGYTYAITNDTTLGRYDLLAGGTTVTTTLSKDYDVYSLIGLTYNANFLYIWGSKRDNISGDSYTPVSSDILVYNRETLEKVAHFPFVRTGLDTTGKRTDDAPAVLEPGRGMVDISNTADAKYVVLVVYDNVSSDAANIVLIDEGTTPPTCRIIVNTTEIQGWNIDNESPIPDNNGGFYFGTYSGDVNSVAGTSKDCGVYHWTKDETDNGKLISVDIKNAMTTADLVIAEGKYAHGIVIFRPYSASYDITSGDTSTSGDVEGLMRNYIWNGTTSRDYVDLGNGIGVELEKPFSDGKDGIYFMMEMFLSGISSDDWDALCHWEAGKSLDVISLSTTELEVEEPPLDGNGGFYFVQSFTSPNSVDIKAKTGKVKMVLRHCGGTSAKDLVDVSDLGTFDFPPSVFESASTDTAALALEMLQSEHGFLQDTEHNTIFVGAGPVGGNMTLTALKWTDATKAGLTSKDVIKTFTNKDLGGYAEIATALTFSDNVQIYTISYDLAGGEYSGDKANPTHYSAYENTDTPAIKLINPVKAGYTFTGWTGTGITEASTDVTIPAGSTGNRVYTAHWETITYTIGYDLDGGTVSPDNPTQYTADSADFTLKNPTKVSYDFAGWTGTGLNAPTTTVTIRQGSFGNRSYKATYTQPSSPVTAPVISQPSYTMNVLKGQSSSTTITAAGESITWSMSGTLPAGMTFSGTGTSAVISGTPDLGTAGTYSVVVTAANGGGTASTNVTIKVTGGSIASGDITREAEAPSKTTDNNGTTHTATQTVFRNKAGDIILTSSVTISVESPDVNIRTGEAFTTTVNVDVALEVEDSDLKDYHYAISINDLPKWLIADGDIESEDVISGDFAEFQHKFTLSGTPTAAESANLGFEARIVVKGDSDNLEASGTADMKITVTGEAIISPDVSPDVEPIPGTDSRDTTPTPTPGTDSGDTTPTPTPGTESGDTTPTPGIDLSAAIDTPRVNITNITSKVVNSLGSLPAGTEVLALPASAVGSIRDFSDLSDSELARIPDSQDIIGVLPIIVVTKPAVYVFGVTLEELPEGLPIFLHMLSENASGAMSASATDNAGNAYTFLDDNGNEVTTLPANKHINIAAYLESGKTYAPVITTTTGGSSSGGEDIVGTLGSSNGGCDSGFSVYALVLAALSLSVFRKC